MKYGPWFLWFICWGISLPSVGAEPLFQAHWTDLAQANQQAQQESKPLVLSFERADCPQCQHLHQQVYGQPAVQQAYQGYTTGYLKLEPQSIITPEGQTQTVTDWAQHLGIYGTPAWVFFDHNGQLLTRHQGMLEPEDLIRLAEYVRQAEYEYQPFRPTTSILDDDHTGTAH